MAQQDVYQCTWVFSHPEAAGDMTFSIDYRLSSVVLPRTEIEYASDLADALIPYTEAEYLPTLPASITFERIDVRNRQQVQYVAIGTSGLPGDVASEPGSLRGAVVASKRTGLAGRSYRGRLYLMHPGEASIDAGVITLATRGAIDAFLEGMKLVTGPGGQNDYLATVWSETLQLDNPIIEFLMRRKLGSQRGRQSVS